MGKSKIPKDIVISENLSEDATDIGVLCRNSIDLIRYARGLAARQVNIIQLMTYYTLGKWIVDVEQGGKKRAGYGKRIMKTYQNA